MIGTACFIVFRYATIQRAAHAQARATPHTVEMNLYAVDSSGKRDLYEVNVFAQRSDGVKVQVNHAGLMTWGLLVRRISYPDGGRIELMDQVRTKTNWHKPAESAMLAAARVKALAAEQTCDKIGTKLREETLIGHPVVVMQSMEAAVENSRSMPVHIFNYLFFIDGEFVIVFPQA